MDDLISRRVAIDALHHVDEYNGRSVEAIKNLPPASCWIPITERLPEDYVDVLVTDDSGGYATIGIDCMFTRLSGKREWLASQRVTAWMPAPAPYKENK